VARRRKTWRFRLDDATTLEVSAADGPTEKQVRRRGRWSLILGTLLAALMVVAVASADQLEADADAAVEAVPHGNSASATQSAGTTVAYDFSAQIVNTPPNSGASDNDVFETAGTCTTAPCAVTVTITRSGDWLASSPDAGTPASFSFTSYLAPQDGTIRVTVPSGMPCGTTKTMTAALSATASNGRALSSSSFNLSYVISTPACAANTAPTVDAGGPYSGDEGSDIGLNGATASDGDGPGPLSYLWAIDSSSVGTGSCSLTNATSLTLATIKCTDNGTATVKLTATEAGRHRIRQR